MPPMSFKKESIFMKPNNKGPMNWICETSAAKVAVGTGQRRVEKTVVDSQARSWGSLTRR